MAYRDRAMPFFGSVVLARQGCFAGFAFALCLVSPNIGFLEHAGAATRIFDAPIIGIEAA